MAKHKKVTALKKEKDVRESKGDAIYGEIIVYRARKHIPQAVTMGSSKDQIQSGKLKGNAFAFIDRAFRNLR